MTTGIAEQKTTSETESLLKGISTEADEVSEVAEETPGEETPKTEKPSDKKAEETKAKVEETPEDKAKANVQSEIDKATNSYREKREADTAYIRRLQADLVEAKKLGTAKVTEKALKKLLTSYDEEGEDPEKKASFAEEVKAINQAVAEYNEKSEEIIETADFISKITKNLPAQVLSNNGLDDPNPNVRAMNGMKFVDATVDGYMYTRNFLMAVEEFFPKGDEVRQKLEELVTGMADYEGNDKAKELYLANQVKGLKVTPRKAPPAPSDGSGGRDLSKLSASEKVAEQMRRDKLKKK